MYVLGHITPPILIFFNTNRRENIFYASLLSFPLMDLQNYFFTYTLALPRPTNVMPDEAS